MLTTSLIVKLKNESVFEFQKMLDFQQNKQLILDFYDELEHAQGDELKSVFHRYVRQDYYWRSMHPFHEQKGIDAVCEKFWKPLKQSLTSLQRRPDVFMAGVNDVDGRQTEWVCSMGHLMGLFDDAWLGIPPTRKMAFLRYAEFHRITDQKIAETALFFDVIHLMQQAGHDPLPPQTGAALIHPGPKTHDGLLFETQDPAESQKTLDLVNTMCSHLFILNQSDEPCPPELLAKTWHDDMIWYGPAGIGATYTIPRYQEQHQDPFRDHLKNKVFNGHVCRFAEGKYAGFFGWANLTNTPTGGFLGLPANETRADMRVIDIYRRSGNQLAENWVFIDLLHYLNMQGLDILKRLETLTKHVSANEKVS